MKNNDKPKMKGIPVPSPSKKMERLKEEFIAGARKRVPLKNVDDEFPWEAPEVNERVVKVFNLRLSEPDYLKIKFLVDNGGAKSVHEYCKKAILDSTQRDLDELSP